MITESLVNLEAVQAQLNIANRLKEAGQFNAAIEHYNKALSLSPDNAEIYKQLAETQAANGQLEVAVESCLQALKIRPDFATAYLTLGNIQHRQNQLEAATEAYTQALQIQPNFAEARANLGSVLYKLGRLPEATRHYYKAVEINPNLASVYLMLGNVLLQQDEGQAALDSYQKALSLEPNNARIHFKLGMALENLEKFSEAEACYQKALQLQPSNREVAEKLATLSKLKSSETVRLSESPATSQNQIIKLENLAVSQTNQAKKEDEEYGLQPSSLNLPAVEKATTDSPPLENSTNAAEPVSMFNLLPSGGLNFPEVEAYKQQAEAYLTQGKFREAILACQQALKIRPDFVVAYITLGNALQAEGKLDAAIRAYFQAVELQPKFPEAFANIGSMYFKMGRMAEAITYYQKALTLNPNLAGLYWNLGKAYQKQQKAEEARLCFQRAAELNPQLATADYHLNMGNSLLNQSKREEAIRCYERAIAVKPDWAEAYANMGSAYSQLGNLPEAVRFYQKALELKPDLGGIHFNLGNAYLQLHQYENAISAYRKALEYQTNLPDAYANLGNALSMLGNLEEAVANYQEALVHKPDWAEVYCRIGHVQKHDRPLESIKSFEKAIELNPHFTEAYQQLCDLLSHSTNLAGARRIADQYCQYCGDSVPVMSATAYVFSYLQSGLSELALKKVEEIEQLSYRSCETFGVLDLKLLYEIFMFAVSHLRDALEGNANFYRIVAKEYYKKAVPQRVSVIEPKPVQWPIVGRNLRIGFLSKHFRRHSVGWCSEALIRELTYLTPHVHLYVTGKMNRDEVTERFETMAGKFYWPEKYPNGFADGQEILNVVVQDNLDVLIDLDSMTVPTNVEVMYQYPASVCASWLGFDAPYISDKHYFLCDEFTHPAGVEKHYLEQLVRLPGGSVAIGGLQSIPVNREGLRTSLGIGLDQLTFLCVAPGRKTNPDMVRSQVKILKEVPDSLLVRKGQGDPEIIHSTYRQECEIQGVDFGRIKFLGQTKTEEEHRAIYYVSDVMLDSYPYNGGTHNLEALWANLPVVTRAGDQYLSRMGYAFLKSANLDVGIAWNWEEYTQWGIKFGRDAAFRNSVREHLIRSKQPENLAPLWNPKKLAETMYRTFQELLAKQVR